MQSVDTLLLKDFELYALQVLTASIRAHLDVEGIFLFGSVVRGEADEESDIDLLVVSREKLSRNNRHEVTDLAFEVNLHYGTNFSTLVVDKESWMRGAVSVLPLHEEILREGVAV